MATRKLDFQGRGLVQIPARATVAITNNPAANRLPGGVFVKLDTDPNYFVLCGVGDAPIGVCDSNVALGALAQLKADGLRFVTLGGTVTLNADGVAFVESNATAKAIQATGLRPIGGKVLMGGVSGDVVPIILGERPHGPIVGADVASAATIVPTGEVFTLTGSTGVSAITATGILNGKRILIRAGTATAAITLAHIVGGTITLTADDYLELEWDGTAWHEVGRSVNA